MIFNDSLKHKLLLRKVSDLLSCKYKEDLLTRQHPSGRRWRCVSGAQIATLNTKNDREKVHLAATVFSISSCRCWLIRLYHKTFTSMWKRWLNKSVNNPFIYPSILPSFNQLNQVNRLNWPTDAWNSSSEELINWYITQSWLKLCKHFQAVSMCQLCSPPQYTYIHRKQRRFLKIVICMI